MSSGTTLESSQHQQRTAPAILVPSSQSSLIRGALVGSAASSQNADSNEAKALATRKHGLRKWFGKENTKVSSNAYIWALECELQRVTTFSSQMDRTVTTHKQRFKPFLHSHQTCDEQVLQRCFAKTQTCDKVQTSARKSLAFRLFGIIQIVPQVYAYRQRILLRRVSVHYFDRYICNAMRCSAIASHNGWKVVRVRLARHGIARIASS